MLISRKKNIWHLTQYTWISYQLCIRMVHFHVCESVKIKVVQKLRVFLCPNVVELYILRLYTSQTHAPSVKCREKLFSKFDPIRFFFSGVYIVIFLPLKYFWVFLNIYLEHFWYVELQIATKTLLYQYIHY